MCAGTGDREGDIVKGTGKVCDGGEREAAREELSE